MANLPSGTVTFLFTDIEGSTKLAQQFPDRWENLRDRHHAILQAAMDTYNGFVFQIIGDAFCVAFHTAGNALRAALQSQSDLIAEKWGESIIKVRMGIHTGKAELQNGNDYQGYLTLSRVQRVMSIAYGGQILISNASGELIRGELPEGVSLLDMKEHRLKGLLNPEHLWQAVAPNLPKDFPPLQSLNDIPNNLPVQLTSFIGREKEIAELKQQLSNYHLVTLTGSGGTGKTRLSLQIAAEVLDTFPDGVWFLELAPVSDPDLVPNALANLLGLRESPEIKRPIDELIYSYLHSRKTLLVLDNCEHLIEACARLADRLLHACKDLKILASSREALGVSGEMAWHVPSLSTPDLKNLPTFEQVTQYEAVRLFIERVTLVQPHFAATKDNAPFVAQICFRLDGIPLAIELAAARANVLTMEQIAKRLDDRFRLLTGGARTALPRQQTLRAMIDWSYVLLSEEERLLFIRLVVFVDGWTLDAAERVCSGGGIESHDVLNLLTHLVDKSLVLSDTHSGEARYHLFETIRQYAQEKLGESGESNQMRDRHLDFFLAFAEEAEPKLNGSEQATWMKRLDAERDNFRAAIDWALESGRAQSGLRLSGALFSFWYSRGYWREGRERLERLLARPEAAEHTTTRAAALYVAGFLAFWLRESEALQALLGESQAICLELGETGKPTLARVRYLLATETINRNRALAQHLLEENLVLARETGNTWVIGWTYFFQGNLAILQGNYALARTFYSDSLAQFRKDGDRWSAASSKKSLGWVLYLLEDYSAARSQFEEGVPIYREVGDKISLAEALKNLGYIAQLQGDYQQAIALFEESLTLFRELERKDWMAFALIDLGIVVGQQGDHERADALLSEALPLSQRVGDAYIIAVCLLGLAGIQQQPIRAAQLLAAAQTAFEASDEIIEPFYRAAQERIQTATRATLGIEAFANAWAEGRAMTPEQAIALASEE